MLAGLEYAMECLSPSRDDLFLEKASYARLVELVTKIGRVEVRRDSLILHSLMIEAHDIQKDKE